MASVRNRRNPEVLLDLVRAHALIFRFQREQRPGSRTAGSPSSRPRRTSTHAARLFAELHTTGGSLEVQVRPERAVRALARGPEPASSSSRSTTSRSGPGWPYQKARRLLLGYEAKGRRYPGLLDRSPALTLLDRTTTEDDESGRGVKQRQFVFLFDEERHRESCASGLAWLADDRRSRDDDSCNDDDGCTMVVTPVATRNPGHSGHETEKEVRSAAGREASCNVSEKSETATAGGAMPDMWAVSGKVVTDMYDFVPDERNSGSDADTAANEVTTDVTTAVTTAFSKVQRCNSLEPRAFVALDGPAAEPCSACGKKPSHYRERRGTRRLCRRCYSAAVRREQRAGPPLPNAIDPGGLSRVRASVGRCHVCGLEPAAWSGDGVRLCEACYRRELRRGTARGDDVTASV